MFEGKEILIWLKDFKRLSVYYVEKDVDELGTKSNILGNQSSHISQISPADNMFRGY